MAGRHCLGRPMLRKDWTSVEGLGRLGGRVTIEEGLWGVVITMGIATARENILQTGDLEWLLLHFFCLWGPVSSSVVYSARFNDVDLFHHLMWGLFLLGLAGIIASLDHSLRGLAACTCFLYLVVAAAFLRVACLFPRGRKFSTYWMASNLGAALLFGLLALFPSALAPHERGVLWINVVWEPVATWSFFFVSQARQGWDLPLDIQYMNARFDGFLMMTMVCTFLFPIGLQGSFFQSSPIAAANVVLANVFALALKLSLQDAVPRGSLDRHAIRRSRPSAIAFLLIHPFSMLGIYITGIGFVSAIVGKPVEFCRPLLCGGAATTWCVTAITKSLHIPENAEVHYVKTALVALCSLAFLAPMAFRLPLLATSAVVTATAVALLACLVLSEWSLGDSAGHGFMRGWRVLPPRPCKTADTIRTNIGARVHGMEHFFSVLVAVAVFQLNEELLRGAHSAGAVEVYAVKFMILYGMLLHTMRYAARFGDDDGYHKLLWAGFQVALLLLLEGAGFGSERAWSMYKVTAALIFAALGLVFNGRVVLQLKEVVLADGTAVDGRHTAAFFMLASLVEALLLGASCLSDGFDMAVLLPLVAVILLTHPLFTAVEQAIKAASRDRHKALFIPINIEYVVERFNELLIEVLGVAIIVPNAVHPANYAHPPRAVAGIVCSVALVLALKANMFDVDPVNLELHAIRRGSVAANAFLVLHPPTILAISFMGGSLKMLIVSSASGDVALPFAQLLLIASSAAAMGCSTLTKMTHRAERVRVHNAKIALALGGTLCHSLVWKWASRDLDVIVGVTGLHAVTVVAQLMVSFFFPADSNWQKIRKKVLQSLL
ncbi:hypothetical protein AB1Y20_019649 [Prymnesium parvum]|uniref:Dolichol kinase n=1 Tax=Prymnesium parvum TaxID=97485 RepID=A0AB34JRQ1_PRYPA